MYALSVGKKITSYYLNKNYKILTSYFEFFLLITFLQGFFYDFLLPLVSNKSLGLLSVLPFNLFPTDLIVLPSAIIFGIFASLVFRNSPTTNIGYAHLYVIWLTIITWSTIQGIINQNFYILADVKGFLLRSFIAPSIFMITKNINIKTIIDRFINLCSFFAILLFVINTLTFLNIDVRSQILSNYSKTVWPEMVLLFPMSVLLAKQLTTTKSSPSDKINLSILTLSSISDLWKPNVASFLICVFIIFWLSLGYSRINRFSRILNISRVLLFVVLAMILIILILGVESNIINLINRTYFKENAAIRDYTGQRIQIILLGIEKWLDNPIFGTGLGSFLSGTLIDAGTGKLITLDKVYAHNFPIQLLYQFGIFGFLIIIYLVLKWVNHSCKLMKYIIPGLRYIYIGILGFCISILIISTFSEVILNEITGYFLWGGIGLVSSVIYKSKLFHRGTATRNNK